MRRIVRELPAELAGPEPRCLVDAVAELLACFPVYRSYLPDGREHLDHAFADARRRRPDLAAAFDRSSRCCATRRSRPRCASSRPAAW